MNLVPFIHVKFLGTLNGQAAFYYADKSLTFEKCFLLANALILYPEEVESGYLSGYCCNRTDHPLPRDSGVETMLMHTGWNIFDVALSPGFGKLSHLSIISERKCSPVPGLSCSQPLFDICNYWFDFCRP